MLSPFVAVRCYVRVRFESALCEAFRNLPGSASRRVVETHRCIAICHRPLCSASLIELCLYVAIHFYFVILGLVVVMDVVYLSVFCVTMLRTAVTEVMKTAVSKILLNEPKCQKTYLRACAPSEDSYRIFTRRILDSQGCKVSPCGQLRLSPECVNEQSDLTHIWNVRFLTLPLIYSVQLIFFEGNNYLSFLSDNSLVFASLLIQVLP